MKPQTLSQFEKQIETLAFREMNMKSKRERNKAERKVNQAIDAMIDLQSNGFGSDAVQRALDLLNQIRNQLDRV